MSHYMSCSHDLHFALQICCWQKWPNQTKAMFASQNITTTGHLARARPRLCLSSHSLAGRRLPRPHSPPAYCTSWLVFVKSVFLCLFHLTSLAILIDSQLNIIANWFEWFKRFNIIFRFARSRSQNGCQYKKKIFGRRSCITKYNCISEIIMSPPVLCYWDIRGLAQVI